MLQLDLFRRVHRESESTLPTGDLFVPAHQCRSHRPCRDHEGLSLESAHHQGKDECHDNCLDRVAVALLGVMLNVNLGGPRRGLQSGGGPSHRQIFPLVELTRELNEWRVVLIINGELSGRSTAENFIRRPA